VNTLKLVFFSLGYPKEKELVMNKIEYITVAGKRYAIISFSVLDSFSRSYDNFSQFARSKGFKEPSKNGEEIPYVLSSLRISHPHLLRVAMGYLPQFIGEGEYRYRLFMFPDSNPRSKAVAEGDISDMVHDEPEFENAVCVFRA
jgi:hypothetical protein